MVKILRRADNAEGKIYRTGPR